MRNLSLFTEKTCLSIEKMKQTTGGSLVSCTLMRDGDGSYWHMVYSDGSTADVAITWVC